MGDLARGDIIHGETEQLIESVKEEARMVGMYAPITETGTYLVRSLEREANLLVHSLSNTAIPEEHFYKIKLFLNWFPEQPLSDPYLSPLAKYGRIFFHRDWTQGQAEGQYPLKFPTKVNRSRILQSSDDSSGDAFLHVIVDGIIDQVIYW